MTKIGRNDGSKS